MKALHINIGLSPQGGGPTYALIGMAHSLQNLGVEVEIAATDADTSEPFPYPLGRKIVHHDVSTWFFHSPALKKYGFSLGLSSWLKKHAGEYDLFHIHGLFGYPSLVGASIARTLNLPYLIRPCGELDAWSLKRNRILKRQFLTCAGWSILEGASAVHATSVREKESLRSLKLRVPIVTIPLGVAPSNGRPAAGEFRKIFPEANGKKIILFLSRIDPKKGLDLLLPALKRLREKRADFILAIAGKGPDLFEREVRQWVDTLRLNEHVIFCGFLDSAVKQAALRTADLFVLPSYDENFAVAPVEAMAAGVPVIVSDQIGIAPDVLERNAGKVVQCEVGSIASALEELLEHPDLRRQMGQNGKKLAEEKFDWKNIALELRQLYESIAPKAKPAAAASNPTHRKSFSYVKERDFYAAFADPNPLTPKKARLYLQSWIDLDSEFKGKRVLEIGAGEAVYSQILANELGAEEVTALDLMGHRFKNLERANLNPRLKFVVGDCLNLPFEDACFDFVFGSLILHRFQNLGEVVDEIRRVLAIEGTYLGLEPSLRNPAHVYRHFFKEHSPNEFLLTATRLRREFVKRGFNFELIQLAPRFPFLERLKLGTCVGIRARKT